MALSFVQKNSIEASASSATGLNLVFGSNNDANSVFTVDVYWNHATATMAVTSTRYGALTPIGAPLRLAGALAGWSIQSFYCPAPTAGTGDTINCKPSVTCQTGILIREFTGYTGTPTLDGTPQYTQQTGSPVNTGNVTTDVAVAALVSAIFPENTASSVAAPFTDEAVGGDGSWGGGDYGYDLVTAIQTAVHAVWSNTGGTNGLYLYAISDGAGGGGGGPAFVPKLLEYAVA